MSNDAEAWVWAHSPYSGTTFTIHVAIGDVVNDTHDNQLWMSFAKLAGKARTSERTVRRAIDQMVEDGYLELMTPDAPRTTAVYRFLKPPIDKLSLVTNETEIVTPCQSIVTNGHSIVTNDAIAPLTNSIELKGTQRTRETKVSQMPQRDLIFEATAQVCGIDWRELTDSARGPLAKAVSQLKKVRATPDEILRRAENYHQHMPEMQLTPSALAKHWPAMAEPPQISNQPTTPRSWNAIKRAQQRSNP